MVGDIARVKLTYQICISFIPYIESSMHIAISD